MTGKKVTQPAGGPETSVLQPYDGVRILDLTHTYGAYAGRLYADLGAEVIRIEPPGGAPDRLAAASGDPWQQARFAFLNASKKSIVLDLGSPKGRRDFDRLARSAGIIFLERGGQLATEAETLRKANPQAVVTVISPYGMTGPLADAPASDLVLQAAGGIAWMSGRIGEAPLSLPFDQATMVGSIYAATVSAMAFVDAELNGKGHLIDVSVQECIAHSLQNALQVWDLEQRVSMRGGIGTRDATEDIFPCQDGYVFLASPLALGPSYKSLVAWIDETGHPSGKALGEEKWFSREYRLTEEARKEFRALFTAFTAGRTKDEITKEALKRRIVMGPVNRIPELFEDPQLAYRKFFTQVAAAHGAATDFPGAPYNLTPKVWSVAPAPGLGAQNDMLAEAKP